MKFIEVGTTNRASNMVRKPSINTRRVKNMVTLRENAKCVIVVEITETDGTLLRTLFKILEDKRVQKNRKCFENLRGDSSARFTF